MHVERDAVIDNEKMLTNYIIVARTICRAPGLAFHAPPSSLPSHHERGVDLLPSMEFAPSGAVSLQQELCPHRQAKPSCSQSLVWQEELRGIVLRQEQVAEAGPMDCRAPWSSHWSEKARTPLPAHLQETCCEMLHGTDIAP